MKTAYLIIHIEDVEKDAKTKPEAKEVLKVIQNIIKTQEHIFQIPKGQDPKKPPFKKLQEFDKIYVCGAYHGASLNSASISLTIHSIPNELLSDGIL